MNTILKRRQPKNHAAGVSTVRNPLEKTTGVPRFAMGLRVHVDPEIDRTKEEQDENRHQSTERQHPRLVCSEFAVAGSELPSGGRPSPSRGRRGIAFPPDPTAWLGGPPLDANDVRGPRVESQHGVDLWAWGPISSAAPPGLTRRNRRAIERRPRCAR